MTSPVVTGVWPGTGSKVGGNTVGIEGSGFTGATSVSFGSVEAVDWQVVEDTYISAVAPASIVGEVDVVVTGPGGASDAAVESRYLYSAVPIIEAVSPNVLSASGGETITVTGQCFTGTILVVLGTTRGPLTPDYVVVSDTEITIDSPGGNPGDTGEVVVVNGSGQSQCYPSDVNSFSFGETP